MRALHEWSVPKYLNDIEKGSGLTDIEDHSDDE